MIVNNTKQDFIEMKVAECHVWDCRQLLKWDSTLQFVHPEWFGQPWEHGLPIVAICPSHIIPEGARIEVASGKPLFSPESLQELSNILGDDGAVFAGNTEAGTWSHVEPQVQEPEELKDFVFKHEVHYCNDFLYQEWLMDINEGSPHRHIGGAT